MRRFRKKPVVVTAVQWTGANVLEVGAFALNAAILDGDGNLLIRTLEGDMRAQKGDWIIRGVKGEFYACRADIFEATYELDEPHD